jgi:hypothetical protein
MEALKAKLQLLIAELSEESQDKVRDRLDNLVSVYPFNEYEFMISALLGFGKISLDDYFEIRDEYLARNMYLYIFEIGSPRGFGEAWAQGHLKSLVPDLEKPTKKRDVNYKGDYDFILPEGTLQIRIEVKASRAVDADSSEPLFMKALSYESTQPFWMNFQQIKPAHCDVFVWIAVWRDTIKYWILSSKEVETNTHYAQGQHRGNVGEGQLHLRQSNISDFSIYEVRPDHLRDALLQAFQRQRA